MKVVLDASAALRAVLGYETGPAVLDALSDASVVLAPQLFVAEVTSGLWKYVIAKQLSVTDSVARLDDVLKLVDRYQHEADLAQEVLRESANRRHAVYDLFYAVLARREGAAMLTVDERLKRIARAMGLSVKP